MFQFNEHSFLYFIFCEVSGFLRSRREKAKSKKNKKGKKDVETNSTKDTKLSDGYVLLELCSF